MFINENSMEFSLSYLLSNFLKISSFIYLQSFENSNQPLVSSEEPKESFKCRIKTFSYFFFAKPSLIFIAAEREDLLI